MFSTLLFTLIGFELTIAFMLLMPLFDSSKVAFFDFVDQQSWAKTFGTFLNGVFVLIAGLLVTTLPKLFWSHSAMEIEQLLVQRGRTSRFCFFPLISLSLHRLFSLDFCADPPWHQSALLSAPPTKP